MHLSSIEMHPMLHSTQHSARPVLSKRILVHEAQGHQQLQAVALQDERAQQQLHARHQAARLQQRLQTTGKDTV